MVARGMREARELVSAQRRLLGDAVYELIRHRRRLAFLAGSDSPGALLDAWLAGGGEARIAAIADPLERLAVATSYPDWIIEQLGAAWGPAGAAELAAAMNRRAPLTVRANR